MAKQEFLENFRVARNLFAHPRVEADSRQIDTGAVAQALAHYGVPVHAVDVLTDPPIRQAIKTFSDWPTIPQLHVDGAFIGGCDIVLEMHKTGELSEALGIHRPAAAS